MEPTNDEIMAMACDNMATAIRSHVKNGESVTVTLRGPNHIFITCEAASMVYDGIWANIQDPRIWTRDTTMYISNGMNAIAVHIDDVISWEVDATEDCN